MIKNIIECLKLTDKEDKSEIISMAKGKYQYPKGWKDLPRAFDVIKEK
jgi:hypothetical protein